MKLILLSPDWDSAAEAPQANFFLRISAKILSISKNFCQILPQKARNHDIRDKKARKCDICDKKYASLQH